MALTIGTASARKGEITRGKIHVGSFADGSQIATPVLIATGEKPGPALWLSASQHGPELAGFDVIYQLLHGPDRVDLTQLGGTIVAAPALNTLGIRNYRYYNIEDGLNLASSYPGSERGGTTEQTAAAIWNEVKKTDCALDLHTNPVKALKFVVVDECGDRETIDRTFELAGAFGVTITVDQNPGHSGMPDNCMRNGIPSMTVELTPWWEIDPHSTVIGVRGVKNIMRTLGMIGGEVEEQVDDIVLPGRYRREVYVARHGGYGYPLKAAGDAIKAGEKFLVLLNPYGEVVEEFAAGEDGYILAYPWLSQAVPTGDLVAFTIHPL